MTAPTGCSSPCSSSLIVVADAAARPLHGQGVRRRRRPRARRSVLPARRAPRLPARAASTPKREQRWHGLRLRPARRSAWSRCSCLYLLQRVQDSLPLNPTDVPTCPPALCVQHRRQLRRPTRTGRTTRRENTVSHLTQMVGLAVQNFVSAAVGIAVAIALVRGLTRRRSATIGNFWVDLTRHVTRILLPLRVRRRARASSSQGDDPEPRRLHRRHDARGRDAGRSPAGRSRARRRSRSSAPTAAGPQRQLRPPVREPQRVHQPAPDVPHPAHPVRAHLHVRPLRQGPEAGLGGVRGHVRAVDRQRGHRAWRSRPAATRGSTTPAPTQEVTADQGGGNMEGKEVRFGSAACGLYAATTTGTSTGAVNCFHDSMTPGGGAVPLVNMMLGEVSPGRRRRRPLRHADLRHPVGVHRRAHGRAHAGVPGQEDPGGRDEARRALHPGRAARRARLHGGVGAASTRRRRRSSTPARTA